MNLRTVKTLENAALRALADHLLGLDLEPFHQPAVLLLRQFLHLLGASRPLVAAPRIQPLIQKQEAVAFPVKRLHAVATLPAEQEEGVVERVQLEEIGRASWRERV